MGTARKATPRRGYMMRKAFAPIYSPDLVRRLPGNGMFEHVAHGFDPEFAAERSFSRRRHNLISMLAYGKDGVNRAWSKRLFVNQYVETRRIRHDRNLAC